MRLAWLASTASLLAVSTAAAQAPANITLRPASARAEAEFSSIGSLRELVDGRVLVADPRERRYAALDFRTGQATSVGRKGEGPLEYQSIGRLLPLAGDSTLVLNTRWVLFKGAEIVQTVPRQEQKIAEFDRADVKGTDVRGNLIATFIAGRGQPKTMEELNRMVSDSQWIVRVQRGTGRAETLGRFPGIGAPVISPAAPPRADGRKIYVQGFGEGHRIVAFPDGWVAIVRVAPIRVDWCPPSGKCVPGPVQAMPTPRLSDADKQAWLRWEAATEGRLDTGTGIDQIDDWPAVRPAFLPYAFAAPDGRVIVERFPRGDQPKREYTVIDRRGMISTLTMPLSERIVGVGAAALYIAEKDQDDLLRLRRHPWP